MKTMLLYVCAFLSIAASTTALDTRAVIEQALDEPAAITLDNIRLGDAIVVITEQTGVKIVMAPEVMNLVPYGADTPIQKVEIANIPLRQGLTELFSPLGMMVVVRDSYVEIVPKEALLCLGRPPTWAELDLLAELSAIQPGIDGDALASLQSQIQFLVPVRGTWTLLSEAIRSVGAGPGDDVLTVACSKLGWAWCLSEQRIVIVSMERQIQRQLQQPISLRLNNRPLFDVMQSVGERVNVAIRTEPGTLASLPIHMQRNFSINVHRQTAEQVIEEICAYTGLGYLIEPDGVLFYKAGDGDRPAPDSAGQTTSISMADPYVAKMVVPLEDGKSVEWLIKRSELPEDLQQMRERNIAEMIEALREQARTNQP